MVYVAKVGVVRRQRERKRERDARQCGRNDGRGEETSAAMLKPQTDVQTSVYQHEIQLIGVFILTGKRRKEKERRRGAGRRKRRC